MRISFHSRFGRRDEGLLPRGILDRLEYLYAAGLRGRIGPAYRSRLTRCDTSGIPRADERCLRLLLEEFDLRLG